MSVNTMWIIQKSKSPQGQLFVTEVSVLITLVLSIIALVSAIARKRVRSSFLTALALGAGAAITFLIPYTFGQIQNLSHQNGLLALWGAFLLYAHATFPAAIFSSRGSRPREMLLRFFTYTGHIVIWLSPKNAFTVPAVTLIYGSVLHLEDSSCTFDVADSVCDNRSRPAIIVRFLEMAFRALKIPSRTGQNNDDERLGCIYAIRRQISPDDIRRILDSTRHRSTYLKRYWLSYSLFQNLLSKILGVPSRERSSQPGSNELFQPQYSEIIKCPFEVVEGELALLHDYFYNRAACCLFYVGAGIMLLKQLYFVVPICWCMVITFQSYDPEKQTTRVQYHKYEVDVILTRIMIIAIIMLDLLQLMVCLSSRWLKMSLLRTYLQRKSWEKAKVWDCCINKVAEVILSPTCDELFKPWQRKLGQYSLLDHCCYLQHPFLEDLVVPVQMFLGKFIRLGRKEGKSVTLCENIKNAVIQTLKLRGPQLTNGIATLEDTTELPQETKMELIRVGFNKLHTDVEIVLLWHIATSMYEMSQDFKSHKDPDDFHVATTLSKYCAYLVAFAPELLPDNPTNNDRMCTKAIWDAYCSLKNCESSKRYDKLLKLADQDGGDRDPEAAGKSCDYNLLKQGAIVGKILCTEINDPHKVCRFLSDFWAETILYLAPNMNNDMAHVDRLADGGEFITHLWALLFHVGIVDRNTLRNRPMDTTSARSDPPAAASPRRNSI